MTSLQVSCGLAPPQSKMLATPMLNIDFWTAYQRTHSLSTMFWKTHVAQKTDPWLWSAEEVEQKLNVASIAWVLERQFTPGGTFSLIILRQVVVTSRNRPHYSGTNSPMTLFETTELLLWLLKFYENSSLFYAQLFMVPIILFDETHFSAVAMLFQSLLEQEDP